MSIRTYNTVARKMASTRHTLGILFGYGWSMARVWLEYAYTMARVCLGAKILFPGWEQNIPTLGTKYSQPGNKTGLRLGFDEITSRASRDYVSCPSRLRLVVTLLMMLVLGVYGVKAQTVDYSGTYYIGTVDQTNGFYLCPTEDWYYYQSSSPYYTNTADSDPDKVMPFLTTYKCKSTSGYDASKALWEIRKHDSQNYYYIIHVNSGKYLTYNDAFLSENKGRMRVHLEKSPANDDYALFKIEYYSTAGSYDIISKYAEDNNIDPDNNKPRKYLNINKGNKQDLKGTKDNVVNGVYTGGIIGLWTAGSSEQQGTGRFFLEDFIPRPTIGHDASGNIKITNNATSATIYYTTDGTDPKTSESSFTGTEETLTLFNDGTVIKAVAKVGDEYSNVVTFTAYVHVGISNQYLIQNLERTDFYMIPGDVSGNNTTVNTTSLFRPTMSWYFSDAGSSYGVQYYYIINGHTGEYLYRTSDYVYMKASSDGSDGYKFFIEQGYNAENDPDGFHIVPKGVTDNTYCIYKDGWANTTPPPIANASAAVLKGSGNARRPEQRHTRWNFIAAPDNKLPASLTYDSTNPDDDNWPAFLSSSTATKYFKIENVGTAGRYMCPPTGEAAVGTATTSDNELAWYVVEAGHDDWRKYYYIVHASTGKYLKFNKTIADPPSSMTGENSVLSMLDYDSSASDRYQFVFAKSTIDGGYYIVPKGLEDATYNSYYALYLDGTNPIKSNKNRASDSYKWKFVAADLFCNNPVFGESEGNITITCNTNGAEIHYTTNGEDPSEDGVTYSVYPPATPLSASEKHLIKACAVVSDGATPTPNTASSEVITFIKNPDITFVEGNEVPYAAGVAVEPTVSSVTITPEGGSTVTIDATEYSVAYSNNTDVGEATATISDALPDNNIIISGTSHFNITPKSLGNGLTAADGITITLTKIGENTYSVTVKNGTVTLTQKDDNNPTVPYDYTVSGEPDESGFVATVEAKKDGDVYTGNYTGGAIAVYVKANFPTLTSETDGGSAAAYQAPRNLAAPPDLKACIVTGVDYNAGTVAVQELTYIPEGVPVLLLTEGEPHNADFTATIYEVGEGGAADVFANKLCKSNGSVTANWGQYYIFTKGEFVLSMGDNKTIKEGKYYFENEKYVSGSSPARLYISRRGTTRINKIVDSIYLTDSWYTLNGQKLNKKPTLKGIYIRNGKKYIVK